MNRSLARMVLAAALLPPLMQGCVPVAVTTVGAAAVMANDRRSTGTYVDDEGIEWKVVGLMSENHADAHVNATSFNRRVLLTGEVPTEAMRAKVEKEVRGLPQVRDVVNELQVAGASSMTSRGNDALITSNVKTRMVNNRAFSPSHVKVLTESGVVYLMGLVTPAEGEAAVEVARTTSGVSRVVKVFEYM
jgi:osmotically-inducible protein OsmY